MTKATGRLCHTSTHRGKRVLIKLHDGTKFLDRFYDKRSGCVILKYSGKIKIKNLKLMTLFRGALTPISPKDAKKLVKQFNNGDQSVMVIEVNGHYYDATGNSPQDIFKALKRIIVGDE